MRKLIVVVLACLFLGVLAAPGAGANREPTDGEVTLVDQQDSSDRAAHPVGPVGSVTQSRFDTGLRQVVTAAPHCQAVERDLEARNGEARARQVERPHLELLHAAEVQRGPWRGGANAPTADQRLAAPVLEFPDTWLASEVVQRFLRELSLLVEAEPDLYGYVFDERSESVAVVHGRDADLTPARGAAERLLRTVENLVAADYREIAGSDLSDLSDDEQAEVRRDMAAQARLVLADVDITVEFRPVCRADAGDLDRVQAAVEAMGWLDDLALSNSAGSGDADGPIEFRVDRDLVEGVVRVIVEADGPRTNEMADLLRSRFGSDVELVVDPDYFETDIDQVRARSKVRGRTFQAGRYADKSPHLGGVQIGRWNFSSGACSSGFAIDMPSGGRAMLTAGHCELAFPEDSLIYSGVFRRDKSYNYYGTFYKTYWSERDVGLIGSGSETYRRKIYTDPDPSGVKQRLVTAVWEPWTGAVVCMSGSFTGNNCGGEVVGSSSGCVRDGSISRCGRSYQVEGPDGRPMSRQGDSGGPVYISLGQRSARAVGIISTGLGTTTNFVGARAINKATGGWIAYTCCDSSTW